MVVYTSGRILIVLDNIIITCFHKLVKLLYN